MDQAPHAAEDAFGLDSLCKRVEVSVHETPVSLIQSWALAVFFCQGNVTSGLMKTAYVELCVIFAIITAGHLGFF